MEVRADRLGAATAADETLRKLMPAATGALSFTDVAAACGCAPSTPRSWLLHDDRLTVPDDATRPVLAELVATHLGSGAAATLTSAWSTLLVDQPGTFDAGDGSAVSPESSGGELTVEDRRLVVDQAILLLTEAYAHLPFKRALHAVDPVQRLRLLDYRLSLEADGERPEVDFHREMIDIFTTVRDLHTSYVAPARYRDAVALLPFRIEQFFDPVDTTFRPHYVASKVERDHAPDGFEEGMSITHWNGVPIHRAIELLAQRQAAGNHPAAFARALDSLTVRPLLSSIKPDEEWIDITYLDASAAPKTAQFRWTMQQVPDDLLPDHIEVALGIDVQTHAVNTVRKALYGRGDDRWTRGDEERGHMLERIKLSDRHLETSIPWSFRAHSTDDGRFGYIRVFSFDTRNPTEFIGEFGRLATELPDGGLIVDVRGNPGGSIVAAEGVLQVLSEDPIRPVRAQFTTSPLLLRICERHEQPSAGVPLRLKPWVRSLRQAVATGSTHSQGFAITPVAVLDNVEHRYPGPVVLIVDALCYSATDMFAAGFADHQIGEIVGVGDNTGAGGANVWRHSDLLRLAGDDDDDLLPLPDGIDFRVAVRRTTRVHDHEGEILEDLGIEITKRHHTTRADIFESNRDLIDVAAGELRKLRNE